MKVTSTRLSVNPADRLGGLAKAPINCILSVLICVLDGAGRYVRTNLNMPLSLLPRSGGYRDYEKDAPLTVFGSTQARLVGM